MEAETPIARASRVSPSHDPQAGVGHRSGKIPDAVFLAGIIAASALAYVGRLGFYSDDWAFLSLLHLADDRSLFALIGEQLEATANLHVRPTQVVYQAVLYRLFGLEPLGYHLTNLGVIIAVALLLYAVLRRLQQPRWVAIAVPAVYALSSNYSTDRFWFAAFGYMLTLALWLAALYAGVRAVDGGSHRTAWGWNLLAVALLTVALLGYEIVLPLLFLNIVLPEAHARRRRKEGDPPLIGTAGRLGFHCSVIAAATAVIVYKVVVFQISPTPAAEGFHESLPFYAARLVSGALLTDFGTHGLGLPHTVWWSAPSAGVAGILAGAVVGAVVYFYLRKVARTDPVPWRSMGWARMAAAGVAIYALGYGVFTTTRRVQFSGTGMANRVAAAAALGVAITLVGAAGWASTKLPWSRARAPALRACVAGLCLAGVVVCNGLGAYWAQSAQVQHQTLEEMQTSLPHLAAGSTVLLGGVCPYAGPAPIFESPFDLAGALQIAHGDPSIRADIVTDRMAVEPEAVFTSIYGVGFWYAYEENLLLYDASRRRSAALPNESAARRELDLVENQACPEGRPGMGSVLLPFDRALIVLQDSRFQPWRRDR